MNLNQRGWHTERRTKPSFAYGDSPPQERDRRDRKQMIVTSTVSMCSTLTPLSAFDPASLAPPSLDGESLAPPSLASNQSPSFYPYRYTLPTEEHQSSSDEEEAEAPPGAYALTRIQESAGQMRDSSEFDEEWDPTDPSHIRYDDDNATAQSTMSDQDGVMADQDGIMNRNPRRVTSFLDASVRPRHPTSKLWYRRQWIVILLVSVVFLTGVTVVIIMLLTRGKGGTEAQDKCNFADMEMVDPFLQCDCYGTVFKLTEEVATEYHALKKHGALFDHINSGEPINACVPSNQALLWIATENVSPEKTRMADKQLLNRYVLAFLYAAWGGGEWSGGRSLWASSTSECNWYGVTCDDSGSITSLSLSSNNLIGHLETRMGLLQDLRVLELSRNHLRGAIPREIWRLPHLEELSIGDNHIGGTLPANLGNSTALTRLSMFWNEFEGSIPDSIVLLSNLRELNVNGSNFAESTIPNDIGALSKLETLDLASTRVEGTVPQSISSLSNVEHLDIQNNRLTGGLPGSLERLKSLDWFAFGRNRMSTALPTTFGQLTNLVYLTMEGAAISGTIPSELGRCTKLRWLKLPFNQISGTLATELGNLSMLEEFLIEVNREIHGTIPSEFGKLTKLNRFFLTHTAISGSIPRGLCRADDTDGDGLSYMANFVIPESVEMCKCCEIRYPSNLR